MRFLLLALLLPAAAFAQVTFSPSIGGAYLPLDGATVKGSISVRLAGCPAGSPWAYAIDSNPVNEEYTCPFDLVGDDTLYDTTALTNGPHAITAKASSTLTARFTVANGTAPAPPSTPTATGNIRLVWTSPPSNMDGSALTDLAGYRVYFGTSATTLDQRVDITNPGLLTYQIDNLAPGTWFLAMTAYTQSGAESDFTKVVSQVVTETTPTVPPPVTPPVPPAEVWRVRTITSGTRPAYELVRNATDTAWVQGYKLGDIAVGKPCAATRELGSGASEYHKVLDSDVTLLSPTYKGRALVAVCAKQ